ncbi:hypothetical protein L0U88_01555 [Flavihumibacter sp. RY-1]|uniref:Lipocalin-like protein n=1 Tax=Flavihumibacter fluminis TaxID=2909236 RepID=A0ABS9BCY6_9BACT|nr:hypothetical protein [Flavihumibacter fluminis]MCF1713311.1 hypothetical protein [Flavihumibacter fluminis]
MKSHVILLLVVSMAISGSLSIDRSAFNLVGSTPGDSAIKKMLGIKADAVIDFIRWSLLMKADETFQLTIQYGKNQPNTLGFKQGGIFQIIEGKYQVSATENWEQLYTLKSKDGTAMLNLVAISTNLFHMLDGQSQLLVGNAGWSYTLNREFVEAGEVATFKSSGAQSDEAKLIFEGRTPCREITMLHPEMKASSDCFKIKWRLILNRDAQTGLPSTCTTRNIVDNQPRDVVGTWQLVKSPRAVIYELKLPGLQDPILMLQADKNILYFLDEKQHLLIGNKDFSFTLNRK